VITNKEGGALLDLNRADFLGLLALIVAVVGFPAALGYLFDLPVVFLLLVAVVVFLIVGWLVWTIRERNMPPYTLLQVKKVYRFQDTNRPSKGNASQVCQVVRTHTARSNRNYLTQVRIGNLTFDGSMRNICVDGVPIRDNPNVRQVFEGGAAFFVKVLNPPVDRDDTDDMELSYELINTFPTETQAVIHQVAHKTERLEIEVNFHQERPCTSARVYWEYGGERGKKICDLATSKGRRLYFERNKPKRDRGYRVEWDWPP
jgi:hypothetical protein